MLFQRCSSVSCRAGHGADLLFSSAQCLEADFCTCMRSFGIAPVDQRLGRFLAAALLLDCRILVNLHNKTQCLAAAMPDLVSEHLMLYACRT